MVECNTILSAYTNEQALRIVLHSTIDIFSNKSAKENIDQDQPVQSAQTDPVSNLSTYGKIGAYDLLGSRKCI